jgi:cytochrome c oxidase cbb3-type subunit III
MSNTPRHDIDDVTGTKTTGHEWDGIRELDTPTPRWWLWTFLASIVFAIGYCIAMPAIPLIHSYTKGMLGYSQRERVAQQLAAAQADKQKLKDELLATDFQGIESNPRLLSFAMAAGAAAFGDNCVPCHGQGGQGGHGYPSLADDNWLWGGTYDQIYETIRYGIRSESDNTRFSEMPAFRKSNMLSTDQVRDVAEYVLEISGQDHDVAAAERGMAVFMTQCAVCHGETAKGNKDVGAPDLTDAIWQFGGTREDIISTISNARNVVMPTWEKRLDPGTIKSLAVYVHSLGGGQ